VNLLFSRRTGIGIGIGVGVETAHDLEEWIAKLRRTKKKRKITRILQCGDDLVDTVENIALVL
jgi:hypothetical protein